MIYYAPILFSGNALGIQDWDQNLAWTEVTRLTLLNFHQFPLWNPFKCGGSVQFANPQIAVVSLQTIFAVLLGTLQGLKFSVFFHGVLGFIGFYFLAKQYKLSNLGSMLAAVIFSFSGITGSFLSAGMVVFTSFAYTPFILVFFNKSLENRKWGLVAGILFALSFYAGFHILLLLGVYILIYTYITCLVKQTLAPFISLGIMAGTAVCLMLPKLILSLQLMQIFPRLQNETSGFSFSNFFYFLLSQKQNMFREMDVLAYNFGIGENSVYVGILPAALFLYWIIFSNNKGRKEYLILLLSTVVTFWLMLGNDIPYSLYAILKNLPFFSSFRVAQRFRFDFIIPFSLLIGLGLDKLSEALDQHRLARYLPLACVLFVFIDFTIFSSSNFLSKTLIIKNPVNQLTRETVFSQVTNSEPGFPVEEMIALPEEFQNSIAFLPTSYEYLRIEQNEGTVKCYDSITTTESAVGKDNGKYKGEFYLSIPVQGVKAVNTYWSPNKLVYQITHPENALNDLLIVNQNYYPGWIIRTGTFSCKKAIKQDGLIAAKLDASTQSITFEFKPLLLALRCLH